MIWILLLIWSIFDLLCCRYSYFRLWLWYLPCMFCIVDILDLDSNLDIYFTCFIVDDLDLDSYFDIYSLSSIVDIFELGSNLDIYFLFFVVDILDLYIYSTCICFVVDILDSDSNLQSQWQHSREETAGGTSISYPYPAQLPHPTGFCC